MPTGAVMSGIRVMTSRTRVVAFSNGGDEAHVAVGDDADEHAVAVDDREPGHPELAAERVDLGDGGIRRRRHRVGDHAGLAALDLVDLLGLVRDREVAVQHADAALARHGDRHARLGHGVHRAGDSSGVATVIRRVSREEVSASLGMTSVCPGRSMHVVVGESDEAERIWLVHASLHRAYRRHG